jgi:hypothetical protein
MPTSNWVNVTNVFPLVSEFSTTGGFGTPICIDKRTSIAYYLAANDIVQPLSTGSPDYLQPEWYGAVGDGVTDDTAAFVAMRTAAIAARTGSILFAGPEIRLSRKVYLLASSYDWKGLSNIWRGVGSGMNQFPQGSVIKMAAGATFTLDRGNTELGGVGTTISAAGGDNTQFHDIAFKGPGKGIGVAPVFWARARPVFWNCTFTEAGGAGLQILATAGGGGATEGNANCWLMVGGACSNNGVDGIVTLGADTNAGEAIGTSFDNNAGAGAKEWSFLGNQFPFCHFAINAGGHVNNAGASNISTFGDYFEIDGSGGTLNGNSYARGIGATTNFPTSAALGATDVTGSGKSVITAFGGLVARADAGGKTMYTAMNTRVDTFPALRESYHSDFCGGATPFVDGFQIGLDAYQMRLGIAGQPFFAVNGTTGTRYMHGRAVAVSAALGVSHIFVGQGPGAFPDGRCFSIDDAAPTTGEWAQGDIRVKRNAALNGNVGWICTVGGTPGTHQTWGIVGSSQAASCALAAGATPTKAEFDAVITSLKNAKLMA